MLGSAYTNLFVWTNLNFLHISQLITLPTQSCLEFYSFCANLLHSLIMSLIVSPVFTRSLYLIFCCVLSSFWYDSFLYLFTNPSARAGYDTRSIFKWSLTGLNTEFSFSQTSCLTKAEEPSLPYYLSIAGGRIIGFIPFPRVLVPCEMQSVSSRIWTRVVVSISYDNNHYTTFRSYSVVLSCY